MTPVRFHGEKPLNHHGRQPCHSTLTYCNVRDSHHIMIFSILSFMINLPEKKQKNMMNSMNSPANHVTKHTSLGLIYHMSSLDRTRCQRMARTRHRSSLWISCRNTSGRGTGPAAVLMNQAAGGFSSHSSLGRKIQLLLLPTKCFFLDRSCSC